LLPASLPWPAPDRPAASARLPSMPRSSPRGDLATSPGQRPEVNQAKSHG